MAKYKRRSAPSDSWLEKWWRKAVKRVWGERCVLCGAMPVQVHHIVHRGARKVLRHDWKNGIPLCAECHNTADTLAGRQAIAEIVGEEQMDYLLEMELWLLPDFLQRRGMTRGEFLRNTLEELKRVAQYGR